MIRTKTERGEGSRGVAFPLLVLGLLALAWAPSCGKAPSPATASSEVALRLQGPTMGTTWSASLYGVGTDSHNQAQWEGRLQAILNGTEKTLTTWNPKSELMQFNASSVVAPNSVPACRLLGECLALALQTAAATNGAFDPTIQPLVDLWGFGAIRDRPVPSDEEIDGVLEGLGYDKLSVTQLSVTGAVPQFEIAKQHADLQIDLSAIAKGFAADFLCQQAIKKGASGGLIEVGGEIRVFGARNGGGPWRVGVEEPASHPGAPKVIGTILGLDPDSRLKAVATSGDSRNRRTIGDYTFSHIIDPRTGRPLIDPPASVTVVAEDCATADAWATALLVLGPEEGLPLARRARLEVCFQLRLDDGSFLELATEGYAALVAERLNR